jgi:hypothetical protein
MTEEKTEEKKELKRLRFGSEVLGLPAFCSDEPTKYAIDSIFLFGRHAYATDGRRLVRIEAERGGEERVTTPVILGPKQFAAACTIPLADERKKNPKAEVVIDENAAPLAVTVGGLGLPQRGGRMPSKVDEEIIEAGRKRTLADVTLSPRYLLTLAQFAEDHMGESIRLRIIGGADESNKSFGTMIFIEGRAGGFQTDYDFDPPRPGREIVLVQMGMMRP